MHTRVPPPPSPLPRRFPLRALPLALLALTACGDQTPDSGPAPAAAAVTVANCGHTVAPETTPERIVTLNQGATEIVLALGAEEQLVGTAYLDDEVSEAWADAYARVPVLSDEYPSREAILEQRPDLVVGSYASAFTDRAAGDRESLDELGIASYLSPFACPDDADVPEISWETIHQQIEELALLLDREEEGDALVEQQRATLDEIRGRSPAEGLSVLWWDGGTDTPMVGAGEGGPQLILDALGATNVFADLAGEWATTSWEAVLEADPDLIVLVDASWDTAEEKTAFLREDPALRDLTAVREEAFITVPFSTSTPGVRNVEAVQLIDAQLADG